MQVPDDGRRAESGHRMPSSTIAVSTVPSAGNAVASRSATTPNPCRGPHPSESHPRTRSTLIVASAPRCRSTATQRPSPPADNPRPHPAAGAPAAPPRRPPPRAERPRPRPPRERRLAARGSRSRRRRCTFRRWAFRRSHAARQVRSSAGNRGFTQRSSGGRCSPLRAAACPGRFHTRPLSPTADEGAAAPRGLRHESSGGKNLDGKPSSTSYFLVRGDCSYVTSSATETHGTSLRVYPRAREGTRAGSG